MSNPNTETPGESASPKPSFYGLVYEYGFDYDEVIAMGKEAGVAQGILEDMYFGKPVERSKAAAILKAFSDKVEHIWTVDMVNVSLVGVPPNQSEIALLRKTIDAEYESAVQGLHGLAQGTARHQYINVRTARLAGHVEALSAIADKSTVDEVIIKLRTLGEYETDAWIPL